jgi:membrane protease YdiL (CAAX protease family)
VALGIWGGLFLLAFGLVVPWLAARSARLLDELGPEGVPRLALYAESVFWLVVMLAASLGVARAERIGLFGTGWPGGRVLLVGLGFLALLLVAASVRWATASPRDRGRLARLAPRSVGDALAWAVVSLLAGVAEEMTYRGVMVELLARQLGSPWAAVLLSALAFAVGHVYQGGAGVVFVFGFALGFHALVAWTGRLEVGIGVHAVYDLIAGLLLGRLAGPGRDRGSPPGDGRDPGTS